MSTDNEYEEFRPTTQDDIAICSDDSVDHLSLAFSKAVQFAKFHANNFRYVFVYRFCGNLWMTKFHPNRGKLIAIAYPDGRIEKR